MIFFICGTDHFRTAEKLKELKSGFIQKRDKAGLNVSELDGETAEVQTLRQEIMAAPFLGEKRMVIVKNILKNKKAGKELEAFLMEKGETLDSIVCFVDYLDGEKVKMVRGKAMITGKLYQYLAKQKFAWEFYPLSVRELPGWINNYAKENNFKISRQATEELAFLVGSDLVQMANELTKLKAYCNDKEVDLESVKLLVRAKFDDNIFNLVEAVARKNKALSMKLLAGQIKNGTHEMMILKMLIRQFKILIQIKGGASASQVGLPPFIFPKAQGQAQGFSAEKLLEAYRRLLELEVSFKSGAKNPELLLDLFVEAISK
jgi:DNA polymerase-3 subunit delta